MSFNKVLYNVIKTSYSTLIYGPPMDNLPPYTTMQVVTATGQPETLCETQANSGETTFQFSYSGQTGPGGAEDALETLRNIVIAIIGTITYNTESYDVWQNLCDGVRPLGGPSMNTWDAIFEARLYWRKI